MGILSSAAAAGWLLSHLGPQKVLAAMAVLPLSVVLASMGVREQHIPYPASDDTGTGSWPLQVHWPGIDTAASLSTALQHVLA